MITLVLDNIRSLHNVGSILRTADGFGCKKVVCVGITPYTTQENDTRLPHVQQKAQRHIAKTALGAEQTVECLYFETIELAKQALTEPWIGLEQTDTSESLVDFTPPSGSYVLVLGNEPDGLSQQALEACRAFVEIPMSGQKESFNVSVACGIALYGLLNKRV